MCANVFVRHLAHVRVEHSARKKALEVAANKTTTWSEWLWGTKPDQATSGASDDKMETAAISEEDWNQLSSLLGVEVHIDIRDTCQCSDNRVLGRQCR